MNHILHLEDSAIDADLVQEYLRRGKLECALTRISTREEFDQAVRQGGYDLILADYSLPSFDGMAALEIAHAVCPEVPFIFVSAALGEEIAIEALKHGATDYVVKQRLQRLPSAVERALAEAGERRERRNAEERQKLLLGELSHRVKNTLAIVHAIALQTIRSSASLKDFETAFLGRLRALAEAHALLLAQDWRWAKLQLLVEEALVPFIGRDESRLRIHGPDVLLKPQTAMSMSMVLHELATNAARHGALRAETGCISVDWNVSPTNGSSQVRLLWSEAGGPPVSPPLKLGFGTQLIRRSVQLELDGEADLSFPPDGMVCQMRFPLH